MTFCRPGQSPGPEFERYGKPYDLDQHADDLVALMEKKGWDLPDMDVRFDSFNSSEGAIMAVHTISGGEPGKKWELYFGRIEFTDGRKNALTGLQEIKMPGEKLSLYHDGSASYLKYTGDHWNEDEQDFMREALPKDKYLSYSAWNGDNLVLEKAPPPPKKETKPFLSRLFGTQQKEDDPARPSAPETLSLSDVQNAADSFLVRLIQHIDQAYPDYNGGTPMKRLKELTLQSASGRGTMIEPPEARDELYM